MITGLKPYRAMKSSGVDWLEDVPEHWGVERLGNLLRERGETNKDGSITHVLSVLRQRGVIPYEEKGNIGNKKSEDISRYKVVRPDDIVVNCMNVIIGSVGLSSYTGCLSPVYYVLTTRGDDSAQYLNAIFQIPTFHRSLVRIGNGILAHRMRIPMELLKCELLPRPPLAEQAAIVRYLDHVDRRISRYIRAKERLIELLEEQKQAIVHQAVTRGLDPSVPLKPTGVEWLGGVPEHWEVVRLKGHVWNVNQTAEVAPDEPYVALEHVQSWTGRIHEAVIDGAVESQLKRFRTGDVLFGKLRPYLAKVARPLSSGVCVGEFLVLRPDGHQLSAAYVEHVLRSQPVIDAVNASTFGAKMPRADWRFVGNMSIPLPPLAEQKAIVRDVCGKTAEIDAAIARPWREIELLREYRTRLIADVVTGKLDVREAAADLPEADDAYLEDSIELVDVVAGEFGAELEEVAT